MPKKPELLPPNYPQLLTELKELIAQTKEETKVAVARVLAEGYWHLGERITALTPDKANLGLTLDLLSRDLSIELTQLKRFLKFYELWSEGPPTAVFERLTWSHYKLLLGVSDPDEREYYLEQAQENAWAVRQLSQRIKDQAFKLQHSSTGGSRGGTLTRSTSALHIYKTRIEHVVDGDTVVVSIDLGFDVWVIKRLRLRGIDTPEMKSDNAKEARQAQEALEFVQKRLTAESVVVAQTFMVDLHGRFVADVFYLPGETDKETIFAQGRLLNQELLDAGLAQRM